MGGGDKPLFHPNIDIRPMPSVDIVADLNQDWPVGSEEFDGVFSQFILEHISWRNVRRFIANTHRVLKPGGVAFFITANLLEQARKLVNSEDWNDDLICMIFGDNDYPENTHRCGFSPKYAYKLFKEAGFYEVRIGPLPWCETDMWIYSRKSKAKVIVGGKI